MQRSSAVNLAELQKRYRRYPIVLYTGAGVSRGGVQGSFGLPGWLDLLKEVLKCSLRPGIRLPEDPWAAAEKVINSFVGERELQKRQFQTHLMRIVQARKNYTFGQRQLSRSFLNEAATLNAVAAFCARLIGQVQNAKGTRYDIGPNRRVRAVVTSNYDPFLEAAFSTKFIKPLLKPVAAYGSHVGNLDKIPVFHIHGYVPHPAQRRPGSRKPLVSELVLSRDAYKTVWDKHDAFGSTMTTQIHFLRHYTILFVGFSFADKYVRELLKKIEHEYRRSRASDSQQHFALIPLDLFEKRGGKYFEDLGIRPIVYRSHNDILSLLGEVYASGLAKDYGSDDIRLLWVERHTHRVLREHGPLVKSRDYWPILLECRNGGLPGSYGKSAQ